MQQQNFSLIPKFNGNSFGLWKIQVVVALESKGLEKIEKSDKEKGKGEGSSVPPPDAKSSHKHTLFSDGSMYDCKSNSCF